MNMFDELQAKGDKFDYAMLGKMLGIPFVPTIGSKGKGIHALFAKAIEVYEDKDPLVRHIHINYGKPIQRSLLKIQDELWKNKSLTDIVSSRFYAIKLLEKDEIIQKELESLLNFEIIKRVVDNEIRILENSFKEDSETLITDSRYGFIAGALKETFTQDKLKRQQKTETEIIDTFITHKIFGFPIFLFFPLVDVLLNIHLG